MNIGGMNRYVLVQRPDSAQASGYADVDRVWAEIVMKPGAATTPLVDGAAMALVPATVAMWYRTDIKGDWRIVDEELDQTWQVGQTGDPDGTRERLVVTCVQVQ